MESKFKIGDKVSTGEEVGIIESYYGLDTEYYYKIRIRLEKKSRVINEIESKLTLVTALTKVGLKDDTNKLDLTLVNKELVEAVARGMTYGLKYGRDNYKLFNKDDIPRFEAALLRHMYAHLSGEEVDLESGNAHLDHVASTLNIIMWIKGNK